MSFRDYISYCDNGRTNALIHTIDVEEISGLKDLGWIGDLTINGYRMKSPEVWLVDLTDPWKINYFGDPVLNLAYYNYLSFYKEHLKLESLIETVIRLVGDYYHNFEFCLSEGPALETEIRILGSDRRVLKIRDYLFEYFLKDDDFHQYLNKAKGFLYNGKSFDYIVNTPLHKQSEPVKDFFIKMENTFHKIGYENVYNPLILRGIINQLPPHDIMLFSPTGCFKFLSSFICNENLDSLMFYEIHADRNIIKKCECFSRELTNKSVLIVDSCYSGKTLKLISDLVIDRKGKPIKLAVFPKSRKAVEASDYVLIGNKIINRVDINTDDLNWSRNIYKQVF